MKKYPNAFACGLFAVLLFSGTGESAPNPPKPPKPPEKPVVTRPSIQTPGKKVKGELVEGTLDSLALAGPGKRKNSEIYIGTKTGNTIRNMNVLVTPATTILDTAGKAVSIESLAKGSPLRVKYLTTKDGAAMALSIRVVR